MVAGRAKSGDSRIHLLGAFVAKHKWSYIISVFAIMCSEFVAVQFPRVVGDFTNSLSKGHLTSHGIMDYALLLMAIGGGTVVLYGVGQFRNGQIGRVFEYEVRTRLFDHWETLSTSYFREKSIGDLLNHALNDVRAVREALSGGFNIMSNAVFLLIAALFMTFSTVSVKLTLISMLPIVFVPIFVVWFGPKIRNASRRVQEGLSDMADLTEESITAIRLVKSTANEDVELHRFTERVDAIWSRQMAMFRRSAVFQSFIPLMGSLSFAIALSYGGYMTLTHQISLGMFVAFTLYLAMIIQPLTQIGFVINMLQRASASIARLTVLLSVQPTVVNAPNPVQPSHIEGKIAVNLPSFTYPDGDHPALADIAFTLPAGATLGVVGRTGSGKTTLVNLLPRIFDPAPGSVYVDDIDVRQLDLRSLRGAIAYVPQDGFLFSATIRENIGFSRDSISEGELVQAARDACIYDDVQQFHDGFDTEIGERGVALSGGQKQRTAIARALIKNAPILIMDDSLSAVDMQTEKQIIARFKELRAGKTNVIVAHRLSAIRHADLIIVLEEGRLVERGTHDTLLQAGGIYADMYALQETGEGESA